MQGVIKTTITHQDLFSLLRANPEYKTLSPWIPHLLFSPLSNGQISFSFSDPSLYSLFPQTHHSLLSDCVQHLFGSPVSVSLTSPATPSQAQNPDLLMSFDSYLTGPSNRLALAAARSVCDTPGSTYNPLFLYSDVGLGKTHLLSAIYNQISLNRPDLSLSFLNAHDFLASVQTYSAQSALTRFRSSLINSDVLLVDDIHVLANHLEALHELFILFDSLYNNHRQIVFSSLYPPKSLSSFPHRILSRFQWGLVVEISPPSLHVCRHILHLRCKALSLTLPPDAIDFLLSITYSNIREIEGVISRINSHASLLSTTITLSLVKDILHQYQNHPSRPVTLDAIKSLICDSFSLSVSDILSPSRARSIAYPRQIAMYLSHSLTRSSLQAIGTYFGGRDHSTVKHGCEKIRRLISNDLSVRSFIEDCVHNLQKSR